MILLTAERQHVAMAIDHFFPYINLYKETRLHNVAHAGATSEEYLTALTINCLLTEVDQIFRKKWMNTIGPKIKFQFSDAQGIVLYRALLVLPLAFDQYYLQNIRNLWLQLLDQQIIQNNIKQHALTG